MTVVEYNGVTIWHCLTREFSQEPMFSEDGVDYLGSRFRITVVGYVHAVTSAHNGETASMPSITPIAEAARVEDVPMPQGFTGAALNHVALRHKLEEPRGLFRMFLGRHLIPPPGVVGVTSTPGDLLIEAWPAVSRSNLANVDINNGPRPLGLRILQVVSDNYLKVEWSIEVCKIECADDGTAVGDRDVLSHRFRTVDDVDGNGYCVRTFSGTLRLRTALVNPHSFRHLVLPVLALGFKRERMHFEAQSDGLALRYEIVDKQVAFAAPEPATSWGVTHTERSSMGDKGQGLTAVGEIHVWFSAPWNVRKGELLALASRIIDAKLRLAIANHKPLTTDLTIIDHQVSDADNRYEVRATVLHQIGAKDEQDILRMLDRISGQIGRPITSQILPGYDPRVNFDPGTSGSVSVVGAFHSAIQTACQARHSHQEVAISATDSQASGGESGELPLPDITEVPPGSITDGQATDDHVQALYLEVQVNDSYTTKSLKVAMPIARPAASSSAPLDTVAIVHMGPEVASLVRRIRIERARLWPQLPRPGDYEAGGIRFTSMGHSIMPKETRVAPDGTRLYAVAAEYHYAMSRPLSPDERVPVLPLPFLKESPTETGYELYTGPLPGSPVS